MPDSDNKNNSPEVSIVILTKNGEKYLEEVLSAIYSQKTGYSFEVIAIDSGSKDRTLEILQKYPVRLFQINPWEFNHGLTRNMGAKKAKGKYIVYLTQDATPANSSWLENLVKPLEEDKMVAGAYSRHIPREDCNPMEARQILTARIGQNKKVVIQINDREDFKNNIRKYIFFANTSSCIRKDVLLKYFFPRTNFAEDQWWAKEVLENHYKTVYAPDSMVRHSHNYSLLQNLKRNFDDAKAFRELFDQENLHSLSGLFIVVAVNINQDFKYIKELDLKKVQKLKWFLYTPLWNLTLGIGQFLGTHFNKIPNFLIEKISLQSQIIKS